MLTVFVIDGIPDHIHFCKSKNFEQILTDRDIDKESVKSQEFSIEPLIRVIDGGHKLFVVFLT